jgi:opacity protein-like surface antigen
MSNRSCAFLGSLALFGLLSSSAVKAADIVEEVPPEIFSWSGFYAGVHLGVTFGRDDHEKLNCDSFRNVIENDVLEEDPAACFKADIDDALSELEQFEPVDAFNLGDDYIAVAPGHGDDDDRFGILAGGQLGVNWQSGSFVFGIEADASAHIDEDDDDEALAFEFFSGCNGPCETDLSATSELFDVVGKGFVTREADINWLSTIRGRLGFAFGSEGRFLLYGTGGVAFAGIDSRLSGRFEDDPDGDICEACFFGPDDSNDRIKVGWTAGGGGEVAVTDRVSFGLEYLFVKLGEDERSITFTGDVTPNETRPTFDIVDKVDFDLSIVRAKLNVRF